MTTPILLDDNLTQAEIDAANAETRTLQARARLEDQLWRDAISIAWHGACNPLGVLSTMQAHARELVHNHGGTDAAVHPALHAMGAHLLSLLGEGSGPSDEDFTLMKDHARRLGIDL